MARFITITLDLRKVSCTARLLDDAAPRTCNAVWDALPLTAPAFHGKYARNEVYGLLTDLDAPEPGPENTTITPIPRDVCWFSFSGDQLGNPAYGYKAEKENRAASRIVDLAIFYGRNNLLINGDQGWVPGNVFAEITDGYDDMVTACQDVWMGGARGETLTFDRVD
ncbi:DUF3830 family protein [Luteipulveratus halotolerans]|uniref:DUF3830 domain-containing protein n=1 Tax=Luteipulveratus halotolerans TaxID=1631356 RepID=A0A0L6CIM7_9MICO|nr:DUF3830 family protein [Luteipulveratus halotolerans]KNX37656.1 hypothetical protein VV01_11690 [Luteipulveratus halotolerans]